MARRSTKCEYKGKKFDSLVEREYYKISEQRQANGEIFNLRIQEKYILQEGFRDSDGAKIQAITYAADQVYEDKDGITHIVDVKGSLETVEQVFLVKWKMLKNIHRDFKYHIMLKYDGKWWDVNSTEEKKKLKELKAEKKKQREINKNKKKIKRKK